MLVFILANTEDIWLSPEGIFLVPSFLKHPLICCCCVYDGRETHGMACACLDAQMVSELTLWSSSLYLCVFWGLNSDCQARIGSPFICGTILQTSLNIYLKRCTLARPSMLLWERGFALCWYCPFSFRSIAQYASLEYRIHFISQHALYAAPLPSVVLISLLYAITLLMGMSFLFAYHKL